MTIRAASMVIWAQLKWADWFWMMLWQALIMRKQNFDRTANNNKLRKIAKTCKSMFSGMANLGGLQADRVMEMETPVRQFHFCHLWHQHHCHCNCKFYCCHCPVVIVIFVIVNCSSYGVTCLACTAVLTVLKYNHHHFYNVFFVSIILKMYSKYWFLSSPLLCRHS